jgi:N-acetylglucosaminyldiphosphoundecaprenol N-acetyl-beta-D-mannosaminyltransferase
MDYNIPMPRIEILGVPTDVVTQEEVLQKIIGFLRSDKSHHIATPNPEMIVEAQRNLAFKEALRKTSLNVPDGVGLVWALRRAQGKLKKGNMPSRIVRVTGTDTLLALCSSESRISPPERIFLLGAAPGIAERSAEVLREKNPALKIVGAYAGSPKVEAEEEIIQRITAASPTLLFVAYGAPAQDLWIARNLGKLPSVKVAMGVGGALDFIVGKQKRAPRVFQSIGLEWLWRLLREPRRAKRIWNAVVVFPWMVLRERSRL